MENRCLFCGEIIPEGLQVCKSCEYNVTNSQPPCKGCEERTVTCHTYCERYLIWSECRKKRNLKNILARKADSDFTNIRVRNAERMIRHRRK